MPITIRTTAPDITTNNFYQTYKNDLDCVSILTYHSQLVTAWNSSGITVSSSQVTALDNSFAECGNTGKSILLRPGISMNTRVTDNATYNSYKTLTESMGVGWIIGYVSGDPTSGGQLFDFPWPNDPQMRILTEHIYEFLRRYLTATTSTTVNGVTFGACPCSNPGTAHARKKHVLEVNCVKPTFQFHEMTGGYSGGTGGTTNATLFHAFDGFGATVTSTNKVQRAEQTMLEWDWALGMVWAKLGDVCRTSIATGTIWGNYTVNNYLSSWSTYPPGWLTVFRTNLQDNYYDVATNNEKEHLKLAHSYGITVGMQLAAPTVQPWNSSATAQGMINGCENILTGVQASGNNGGYGDIEFVEISPDRLDDPAYATTAVGGWPGGSTSGLQYWLTSPNSVNARTAVFSEWNAPVVNPSTAATILGSYAT